MSEVIVIPTYSPKVTLRELATEFDDAAYLKQWTGIENT